MLDIRRYENQPIEVFVDNDGDYYNCWGITDNVNSELLRLKRGIDFV